MLQWRASSLEVDQTNRAWRNSVLRIPERLLGRPFFSDKSTARIDLNQGYFLAVRFPEAKPEGDDT
jgi:hypothetical protein